MENQIEKFTSLCAVFNIKVHDENDDCVKLIKGSKGEYQMYVGKWHLSNDIYLLKTLKYVYSEFRKMECEIK